jgi:hypothetical protein
MASREGAAHVVTTRRVYKGRVYTSHLLRRSYRVEGKVKNETLGNLSHLPEHLIDVIRRSLRGETFVAVGEGFEIIASFHHGHIQAVRAAMARVGMDQLMPLAPRASAIWSAR